ncbi:hypothetical protein [Nocardia sp. CA-120079]|uniref:hypothetical protein n=1 Tax=Nocardia sp. CA-120079 TaxID=3239974 RepID=UPI003D96CC3B
MLKAVTTAPDTSTASGRCQFPGCTVAVPQRPSGKRGAPRGYCDNPDHTAQKALRLKRKDADRDARAIPARPSLRPVTDGMVTLARLLDRYEHLRAELAAVADDTADLLADLTDPATVEREIAEIQREATRRITDAEQARDDAVKASAEMARRLERAVELEELALAAADEANTRREEVTARLEQVEKEAAERIAEAESDRDRVYSEAETVLTEMRGHVDAARAAQARAEGERNSAVASANTATGENTHLRTQLDRERAEHRQQIERRDIEYSRAITAAHAMADRAAREHRERLDEVLRRQDRDRDVAPEITAATTTQAPSSIRGG